MIRKDGMGFWTCNVEVRDDRRRINPFLLPANAEQVFCVEDVVTPGWSVVLQHEPRSRRVGGNSVEAFDYSSSQEFLRHFGRPVPENNGNDRTGSEGAIAREITVARVAELDATLNREEDDSHFDNNEYVDEEEDNIRAV